jgi:hypothetical protein
MVEELVEATGHAIARVSRRLACFKLSAAYWRWAAHEGCWALLGVNWTSHGRGGAAMTEEKVSSVSTDCLNHFIRDKQQLHLAMADCKCSVILRKHTARGRMGLTGITTGGSIDKNEKKEGTLLGLHVVCPQSMANIIAAMAQHRT